MKEAERVAKDLQRSYQSSTVVCRKGIDPATESLINHINLGH